MVEFFERSTTLCRIRCENPSWCAARRTSRDRENIASKSGCRRSWRSVLLYLRLRLCGNVCRVGASRVRDLFETAKKNAPAIIFIDEIDAVGRQRGAGMGGGHDEREQTLNQLLVEMDGFDGNEGVIVIAATNRSDVLDPALLRPGRFDRQILVGRPDVKGREAILRVHARNKPLSDDVDLKVVAQQTPGFAGADLENVLNEAALVAARRNKKKIDASDIDEAEDRVIAGPAKKRSCHQ